MNRPPRAVAVAAALLLLMGACTGHWDRAGAPDAGPDASDVGSEPGGPLAGGGVGAFCSLDDDCREGLACREGRCAPAGDQRLDGKCLLSAECGGPDADCPAGLNCGTFGFCTCAGAGDEGTSCTSAADCLPGWRCQAQGFSGYCDRPATPGGDLDTPCADTAECRAGLVCSAESSTCVAGSLLLNPDLFPGVACPDESALPFGVRMRLPRDGKAGEFYSLPFPTDVRRAADGHPDLHDHPRPGGGMFGVDALGGALDALQSEADGFSVNASVYLRFTRPVDPSTVRTAPDPKTGAPATVLLVDLDHPDAPLTATARFVEGRNKYICGNHLVVHPLWARPLRPATRHAVVVTTGVRALAPGAPEAGDGTGEAPTPLDDLPLLLGATAPADAAAKRAWDAYAPLRAWLPGSGLTAADVAGATVFTTGDPRAPLRAFRDLFHDAGGAPAPGATPTLSGVVQCGTGADIAACLTPGWADTPEAQAGQRDPRACPAAKPTGWTEFHGLLRLPVFQEGDAPYATTGGVLHRVDGRPAVVRTEDVCVAIALPDDPAPAAGWPLLVYGHGTGGSFRTAMTWAGDLGPIGVAILGIDGVMHGPRQGPGTPRDPGPLVYNFRNPRAALGNLLQGAADNFSLLRFVRDFAGPVGTRAGRFDPARVAYMGHSQGATTGPLFVPWEDGVKGAAFTGAGASLLWGLLGKKKPYDASVGLRVGLQELHLDDAHPALAILQWLFDPVDPGVHGALLVAEPEGKAAHVLDVVGWDDSYSPWRTGLLYGATTRSALLFHQQSALCLPQGCDLAGFRPDADLLLDQWVVPPDTAYGGNVDLGAAGRWTAMIVASRSDGTYDGHFVGEKNPATRDVVVEYLRTLLDPARAFPTVFLDQDPCPQAASAACPP